MAPLIESSELEPEDIADLFECGICGDILLDPLTLPCCGKVFCTGCLRQWIRTSVRSSGLPQCPAGCPTKISFRLPAVSSAIQAAMERLIPMRLKQRREEEDEADEDDEIVPGKYGGFNAWQEVAAAVDIVFTRSNLPQIGVRKGTPGIVVDSNTDGRHVVVKFDRREDESELCVNVLPDALMEPLPGGLRLGQRIVALCDLIVNTSVLVRLGTGGVIVGRHDADGIHVLFDSRLDGQEGTVVVGYRTVQPQRPLVGGFHVGQEIQTAAELTVGTKIVAVAGARGTVLGEFSDCRITVSLAPSTNGDSEGEEGVRCVNVMPPEIVPWCEPPGDMPVGHEVTNTIDLPAPCPQSVVPAGARGFVLGGVTKSQVLVAFEQPLPPEEAREEEQQQDECKRGPLIRMIVDLGVIKSAATGQTSEDALELCVDALSTYGEA
eukprot:TRINITY_DN6721_c0_g1_i1.p1 TRINITY_DN6721_c0_g1~~TRINITY_DN6721_c0_g1_i1.p1  ORF type:complete len:452 (+),score=99.80 TRINITY_DN6721_c0_g1_i1:50-1357(+)